MTNDAKLFCLTGVAGYVAPNHLRAIKDTGNHLLAAIDKHDSVGILDSYFPDASFFTEFERFDRFLEKQRLAKNGKAIDYFSICSPNYLHDAHCRLALRVGADAICEKPLVIKPWNLDQLSELEQIYGKRVYTVLQLRYHPEVRRLRQLAESSSRKHDVALTYITRRGKWYDYSWKGDQKRSGGLAMNIGIHFFDFLTWIFGRPTRCTVHLNDKHRGAGVIELERARVRWFLSICENDLPKHVLQQNGYAYRSLNIDEEEIDLSNGFADLHTEVYREVLAGGGFGIEDARPSIELVHQIRASTTETPKESAHPMLFGARPQASVVELG